MISTNSSDSFSQIKKATSVLVAFFVFLPANLAIAESSCDHNLSYAQGLKQLENSVTGRFQAKPSAEAVVDFLDSLLVDDLHGKGFRDVIENDLRYKRFTFGRFMRWSWFGTRLKIPALTKPQLNSKGLSDYAVNLAEYLVTVKSAQLRWSWRRSAIDPQAFVSQIQPTVERLHRIAYQIAGMLHPPSLKRNLWVQNALSTVFFVVALSPPPLRLFDPRTEQAFDYFVSGPESPITDWKWQIKAGLNWLISRSFSALRIGLVGLTLYSAASMAVEYGPLLKLGFTLQHAAHSAFRKPVDRARETREVIDELNGDVEYYQNELAHEINPEKKKRLEETIAGAKKSIELLQTE